MKVWQTKHFSDLSTSALVLLCCGSVGPLLAILLSFAQASGDYIPTSSLSFDYLVALIFGVGLGIAIVAWPVSPAERLACLYLWCFKLVTCLLLMLPYEASYDFLDAYYYYVQSLEPTEVRDGLQFAFGTRGIIEVFAAFWTVFPQSYHLAKVLCAYAGLIGLFFFYRAYGVLSGSSSLLPLFVLGLFPSMLFWSSIAGKDPLILLGLGISAFAAVQWLTNKSKSMLLVLVLGLAVTAAVRLWIGVIVLVALVVAYTVQLAHRRRHLPVVLILLFGSVTAWTLYTYALTEFGTSALLAQLEGLSSGWARGGSAVNAPIQFGTWRDVALFLPRGIFTALFRPLPGEINNAFGLLAGAENVLLMVATVVALAKARSWTAGSHAGTFFALFIAGWSVIYAFLSYQNLGTAVRFKVQVLPFMLCLVLLALGSRPRAR